MKQSYHIHNIYPEFKSMHTGSHSDINQAGAYEMTVSAAKTQGAHHIGLTVSDLDAARGFFVDAEQN
jgi:hypothetical protein